MDKFLGLLQQRGGESSSIGNHPSNDVSSSLSGPTVPTALSRRMLHKQGVGYLDPTVEAIASASADRFLATVLQQAVACRDQRLSGEAARKEHETHLFRHLSHVSSEQAERKRKREEGEERRVSELEQQLAGEAANRKMGSPQAKKKKTTGAAATASGSSGNANSNKTKGKKDSAKSADDDDDEDADEAYDSLDEEETYYQEKMGHSLENLPVPHKKKGGDEEDLDETLRLTDIVRPLEAWNFHVTGKLDKMEDSEPENDIDDSEDEKIEDEAANVDDEDDDEEDEDEEDEDDLDDVEEAAAAVAAKKKTKKKPQQAKTKPGPKKKSGSAATSPVPPGGGAGTPPKAP